MLSAKVTGAMTKQLIRVNGGRESAHRADLEAQIERLEMQLSKAREEIIRLKAQTILVGPPAATPAASGLRLGEHEVLLTLSAAASRKDVYPSSILRAIKRGEIIARQQPDSRRWIINAASLDGWHPKRRP